MNPDDLEMPQAREVFWMGDSRENVRKFPKGAREMIGGTLWLIQTGETPLGVKSFKGVGSGVLEIAKEYSKGAYRAVVAVQLGESIYVLHAFQKKSKQGIKTTQQDIELIKQRYKEAQELAKYEQNQI